MPVFLLLGLAAAAGLFISAIGWSAPMGSRGSKGLYGAVFGAHNGDFGIALTGPGPRTLTGFRPGGSIAIVLPTGSTCQNQEAPDGTGMCAWIGLTINGVDVLPRDAYGNPAVGFLDINGQHASVFGPLTIYPPGTSGTMVVTWGDYNTPVRTSTITYGP
jgi:hypothetical protein